MFDHILIPVAPGHAEEYGAAMKVAARMKNEGGKISLLSVMEVIPTYVDAYIPATYLTERADETEKELKAEFSAEGPEINIVSGHPANEILAWAKASDVDCIVIPSHRPGFADFLIGSTAARVVRHAQCSVIVLR